MALLDSIYEPNIIILGVFGSTNKINEQDIQENILTPILEELERVPDKILIPTEGNSSIYIQEWAEALHIKTQSFYSDWIRNGKLAQILRDDRMAKECTHALVFLPKPKEVKCKPLQAEDSSAHEKGLKKSRLEIFAEKLCLKGKIVFTSSHNQTLTQLEMKSYEPVQKLEKASKHVRKLSTGIGQMLLKYQKKVEH